MKLMNEFTTRLMDFRYFYCFEINRRLPHIESFTSWRPSSVQWVLRPISGLVSYPKTSCRQLSCPRLSCPPCFPLERLLESWRLAWV